MTVKEAVKQSRSGGIFDNGLIRYAQTRISPEEDLVCAAIVTVNDTKVTSEEKNSYLLRMGNSYRIRAILCITTKRMVFYNNILGDDFYIDMPFSENPKMDTGGKMNGIGVSGIRLISREHNCFIVGNKKLMNHLKSGIMAAMMIYQDYFVNGLKNNANDLLRETQNTDGIE
ncbi:MAG: hypothetical protein RRZ24_05850 [Clostridia bacterium]